MKSKRGFMLLAVAAAAALLISSRAASATEEPAFERVLQARPFEVRQYRPMIVAETYVDASLDKASSQGFRRIADYIFGNNTAPATAASGPRSQSIPMTAPVVAEPLPVTLASAPQGSHPNPSASPAESAPAPPQRWRIHFVMPSKQSMQSLPRPNNPEVTLRELPARRYAVVVFSGLTDDATMQAKTAELLAWMRTQHLQGVGSPLLARYDPPWTLWFMRRNEVLIELAGP
jgi:SOUL heme-binding protein